MNTEFTPIQIAGMLLLLCVALFYYIKFWDDIISGFKKKPLGTPGMQNQPPPPMRQKNKKLQLIQAQAEYITLLGDELQEIAPIAHLKGWRSTRHQQGEELRKKIDDLKQKCQL